MDVTDTEIDDIFDSTSPNPSPIIRTESDNAALGVWPNSQIDLVSHVNTVCDNSTTKASEDRYTIYLQRETEKSKPDHDTIMYYMDLLFEKRREDIKNSSLLDRTELILLKYPVLIKDPLQVRTFSMNNEY